MSFFCVWYSYIAGSLTSFSGLYSASTTRYVNQFTFKRCERLSEQCLLEEGLGFICHSPIVENLETRLMVSSVM